MKLKKLISAIAALTIVFAMGYFIERLKAVYAPTSGNVNEATVTYLKTVCGITDGELSALRSILLV